MDYGDAAELYGAFGERLKHLFEDLLHEQDLMVQQVTIRVKKQDRAERKLSRPEISGAMWEDLHDFLGARIITYFADDVDRVARVIESEFEVDAARSSDKRKSLDANQFGYLSLHYVAKLRPDRARLTEWKRFAGLHFEIQIRSILQHSWAEIEHDLGYRPDPKTIPRPVRRRFSRLAGLLEIADDEYIAIRDSLKELERSADVATAAGQSIPIDQASVFPLIQNSAVVRLVDTQIADGYGVPLTPVRREWTSGLAAQLLSTGFDTTESVIDSLGRDGSQIAKFAVAWLGAPEYGYEPPEVENGGGYETLSQGISVFYLPLFRLAQSGDPVEIASLWPFFGGIERAEHFLSVFRQSQKE